MGGKDKPGTGSDPLPDKPLVWLHGLETPPVGEQARRDLGYLLRRLQRRENLGMPHSRPMRSIGPAVHELRVNDQSGEWRLFYRLDPDAIVVVETCDKKTASTPKLVIDRCKQRLKRYDEDSQPNKKAGGGR